MARMRSGVTHAATTTAALLLLAMAVCDMQRVKAADPFDASTAGPGCWVIKDGGYLVDAGVDDDGVNVITSYGYPVKYKGGFRYKAVISVRGPVLLTADPHFELEGNMDDMVCSEDYEDADDYEDYAAAALAYDYYYADYSFAPFAYDIRGYEYDVVDNPYSYPPACEGRRSVSCSDWLQWVDGYQYCGRYAPPNVFVQENASVAIEFQSDGSVAGSGFSFNCTRCPDGPDKPPCDASNVTVALNDASSQPESEVPDPHDDLPVSSVPHTQPGCHVHQVGNLIPLNQTLDADGNIARLTTLDYVGRYPPRAATPISIVGPAHVTFDSRFRLESRLSFDYGFVNDYDYYSSSNFVGCPSSCPEAFIGDGVCDEVCNFGGCVASSGPKTNATNASSQGSGVVGYDGGDCDPPASDDSYDNNGVIDRCMHYIAIDGEKHCVQAPESLCIPEGKTTFILFDSSASMHRADTIGFAMNCTMLQGNATECRT